MIAAPLPPRSVAEMVRELARLGILGFGGVGPQAHHAFVERTRWLAAEDFADTLGLAQALPGANVVNLCAILGDRWFGPAGALAAVAAITVPPLIVVLLAAAAVGRITHAPRFVAAECAVVAASAGLILATACRVFATIARRRVTAAFIAGGIAVAVGTHAVAMPAATLAGLAAGVCAAFAAGKRR